MPYRSSSEDDSSGSEKGNTSDEEELAAFMQMKKEKKQRPNGEPKGSDDEDEEECIYNAEVMHDKLEDMAWTQEQAWEETQAITGAEHTEITNVDDDLERELAFYNQALDAAKQAIKKFEDAGTSWRRPADYYAEMVKSDDHMAKVKEQLLYEQKIIETSQQRRKEREAKKFSKQVSAERKKDKAQEKKANITGVSNLRKQRVKEGFAGELDMDMELERMGSGGGRRKGKLGERFEDRGNKSKKREKKDSKFGFGGPKRLKKQNDAYSAADGEFKQGRSGSFGDRGGRGGGGRGRGRGRGGKPQRPGKDRRASMKRDG